MSNLSIEVFTGSPQAFNVNSAIVYGEKDAVLVDARCSILAAKAFGVNHAE